MGIVLLLMVCLVVLSVIQGVPGLVIYTHAPSESTTSINSDFPHSDPLDPQNFQYVSPKRLGAAGLSMSSRRLDAGPWHLFLATLRGLHTSQLAILTKWSGCNLELEAETSCQGSSREVFTCSGREGHEISELHHSRGSQEPARRDHGGLHRS